MAGYLVALVDDALLLQAEGRVQGLPELLLFGSLEVAGAAHHLVDEQVVVVLDELLVL